MLLFTVGLCCFTALAFGLFPALETAALDLKSRLHEGGRSGTGSKRQSWVMSGAVVAQFALAVTLLTGAGLLVQSFIKMTRSDPGFSSEHVLVMHVNLPRQSYSHAPQVISFFDNLLRQIKTIPGVENAAATSDRPMEFTDNDEYSAPGSPVENEQHATVRVTYVAGDALSLLHVS